jgi:hypothetical protein
MAIKAGVSGREIRVGGIVGKRVALVVTRRVYPSPGIHRSHISVVRLRGSSDPATIAVVRKNLLAAGIILDSRVSYYGKNAWPLARHLTKGVLSAAVVGETDLDFSFRRKKKNRKPSPPPAPPTKEPQRDPPAPLKKPTVIPPMSNLRSRGQK